MNLKPSKTRSTSPAQFDEPGSTGETTVKLVKNLPDVHHSTLNAAAAGAIPDAGMFRSLPAYLDHVAHFQRNDQMFEKLEIEVNLGCNRRCTYCNLAAEDRQSYVESRKKTMEWNLFQLLIHQLAEIRFRGVLCFHFYSEPLLNKALARYVRYAKEHLPETQRQIYTNGDYLTLQRHHELTDAGVTLFFVTRHNNTIPDFLVPVLHESNVLLDTRADLQFNNRAGFLGVTNDPRVRSLPCIFTSESVVVTIDGNVLPCSCDFRESIRFGNIRKTHIREIYASERCRQFRRDLLAGRRDLYPLCRNCDFYSEVLGVRSVAEIHRTREQLTFTQIRRQIRQKQVQ